MQFDILTIFPEIFDSYFKESILARAQKKKLIKIKVHNLRRWTLDKHRTVDDRPYGGGPGMIFKVEPIYEALRVLKKFRIKNSRIRSAKQGRLKSKIILLDPAGQQFDQKMSKRFSKLDQLILICGRYEGVDARVYEFIDERVSIGPYVLSGGELPAMVVTEGVARLVPKVLGHKHSLEEETFSPDKDYVEYPQYTRPEIFKYKRGAKRQQLKVPKVLLSGDHEKIKEWRQKNKK